jgi:hypothetical protein
MNYCLSCLKNVIDCLSHYDDDDEADNSRDAALVYPEIHRFPIRTPRTTVIQLCDDDDEPSVG